MAHDYDVVMVGRTGVQRVLPFTSAEPIEPGEVIRLNGRFWLVADVRPAGDAEAAGPLPEHRDRVLAQPARYRIRMRYPDGREEHGAFRRFRTDAPQLGHAFTTVEDGRPESWGIVDERVARDEQDEPYVEFLAERDFTEVEELPDHELEHALARSAERLPPEVTDRFLRASGAGQAVELVALEPGEAPDWDEATRFIAALVLDEIEDDLLEMCGVDPGRDRRDTWLERVKARLGDDLARFRADIEGEHTQIDEWDYLEGRIFASTGTTDDESDPDAGHGWLCRLVDAGALAAAGFSRIRKPEIAV